MKSLDRIDSLKVAPLWEQFAIVWMEPNQLLTKTIRLCVTILAALLCELCNCQMKNI